MAIRFLLDEHLRGVLWNAIERHNRLGGLPIDAVRVGDPADLPLGSDDAVILAWAEKENRILVTLDRHTMSGNLAQHLATGRHSPGVFIPWFPSILFMVIGQGFSRWLAAAQPQTRSPTMQRTISCQLLCIARA